MKGTPKANPAPSTAVTVRISEDLRASLKHLVRDEEEVEKNAEEIPSLHRALTDAAAFEDLVRVGVAYGIVWALGKLLAELFGDGDFI